MKTSYALEVKDLNYSWGKKRILTDVSFRLSEGKVTALLGPNAAGKSTLMKAVSGIVPLRTQGSGIVTYFEENFLKMKPSLRAHRVVYVAPELKIEFPMTAEEFVSLGRSFREGRISSRDSTEDTARVRWAMEKCFCWTLKNRDIQYLSGGEQQLVALARALAQEAKVLFLDEALSRMDLHHQAAVGKLLKDLSGNQGCSVLLVSHDINLAAEISDSAILLKEGKILAEGSMQQVLTQENLQAVYPHSMLKVGENPITGSPQVFFSNR